jgi:NAD(P)H dehydrogenase (quinone)
MIDRALRCLPSRHCRIDEQEIAMIVVTGVTGQVGSVVARSLLTAGRDVRAIVRRPEKAAEWRDQGCDVAVADLSDTAQLASAFAQAEAVFVLLPPNFDPAPGFPESHAIIASVRNALERARPARVVCLSTIGAQAAQPNLLGQLGLLEQAMRELSMPMAFLRAAWFMENAAWDVAPVCESGVLPSLLQPLDRAQAMISALDVGRVAAQLLLEEWAGVRIVELAHPQPVSPDVLAATFARVLGRGVRAEAIPRDAWEVRFREQGMRNPLPRMQMLDGFNQGWLAFEGKPNEQRSGVVSLEQVVRQLLGGGRAGGR